METKKNYQKEKSIVLKYHYAKLICMEKYPMKLFVN